MSHLTMTMPGNLESLTESGWQQHVTEAAQFHGWLVIHWPDMKYSPNPGYPDLTLFRQHEYHLIELKTMHKNSKLGPKQVAWHDRAAWHGVEVVVLRNCAEDWLRLQGMLQ